MSKLTETAVPAEVERAPRKGDAEPKPFPEALRRRAERVGIDLDRPRINDATLDDRNTRLRLLRML